MDHIALRACACCFCWLMEYRENIFNGRAFGQKLQHSTIRKFMGIWIDACQD